MSFGLELYGQPGPSQVRHLYMSRVAVYRLRASMQNGSPTYSYEKVTDIVDATWGVPGEMMCRLDLQFLRPGKDAPQPIVAGRAPDRVAVMYYDPTPNLLAGDRLVCVAGPVYGTFELRQVPDPAQDMVGVHHMESQVIEVSQQSPPSPPYPGQDT